MFQEPLQKYIGLRLQYSITMKQEKREEVKKQLEAVRRSGKTNMYNLDNIKRISVQCGLPHLTDAVCELETQDFIELMSAEDYGDCNRIDNISERIRETKVTKEI